MKFYGLQESESAVITQVDLSSRHFRKALLCKLTASNSACLRDKNPVSSYCLILPCRFAFLYIFSAYSSTILRQTQTVFLSEAAGTFKSLNRYLSLQKGAKSLFFFFGRIYHPPRRCLFALSTVQFKGSLTIFFLCVQLFLESLDRLVQSFSKDHRQRQISELLKKWHPFHGLRQRQHNRIKA